MQTESTRFLPFHIPLIEEDDMRAVHEVMESGWITTGPKTAQFENEFAQYIGARHAIAVNSGTAALHVALDAVGVSEGDEVIVPTLTFAATAEAVVYCKARPVLVDCDPETFNLDPAGVHGAITANTRAILPVHFAGHPCAMDSLLQTARAHNLRVIEDAAHALPARYRGKRIGTLGDLTCFSFYATKSITTGEGGMVTTDDEEWTDRMRVMRLHGISKDAWKRYTAEGSWRYEILAAGFKYNLTDMQAALGISQLAKCDAIWRRRSLLARRYTEALGALEAYEIPSVLPGVEHAWHLYVIRIRPGGLSIHRDRVIEELKQRGIGASVHFIPLHLHPYYRDRWGYRRGDFPVAEDYFERCISLPLYPAMRGEDQNRVIAALTEIAGTYRLRATVIPEQEMPKTRNLCEPAVSRSPRTLEPVAGAQAAPASVERQPAGESSWYLRWGKRLFDLAGAAAALAAGSPVLLACAAAVRLSSPGPIFFRQRRVGLGGRPFNVLKFRTMVCGNAGPQITAAGDARITRAGRRLRRWKLDELPQLFNVLKGEMSLVGPRPEVPEYVARYNATQKAALLLKPGITGPAALAFIDEEIELAAQRDRESYYAEVLLPQKLALDLAYCRSATLGADLRILLRTARRLLPSNRGSGEAAQPSLCPPAPVPQPAPSARIGRVRAVRIEDLLGRSSAATGACAPQVHAAYRRKRVLVTGAGGSIGSELCRQLLLLKPAQLALLDKDENAIYDLDRELRFSNPHVAVEPMVADLKIRERLDALFREFRPQVVLHAAAHKHVPLMEKHPCEAVLNNVLGMKNLLESCRALGVERFVFISSDKAVNPANVMGATKRIGEELLAYCSSGGGMKAAAVRFGNVMGSRGSVIPLFQKQIEQGGPVTVTHPGIVRFFMTIPEAVQLVLCAGSMAVRCETFVLDMGNPRRVLDLARQMIELAGLKPGQDILIEFTGLRPGEKMEEELACRGESLEQTGFEKIFRIPNTPLEEISFRQNLDKLIALARAGDRAGLTGMLMSMGIGYKPFDDVLSLASPPFPWGRECEDFESGSRFYHAVTPA